MSSIIERVTSLQDILDHELVVRFGWALFHSLWLFALLSAVLWVTLRLMRQASSHARYITACTAFFTMPIVMVAAVAIVEFPAPNEPVEISQTGPTASPQLVAMESNTETPLLEDIPGFTAVTAPATGSGTPSVSAAAIPDPEPATFWYHELSTAVTPWLPTFVACWLVGVVLLSVRPLAAWLTIRRFRTRGTSAIPAATQQLLQSTAEALGLRRPIAALQSVLVDAPVVIGYLKPLILLPASAMSGLSTDQLRALLAHEIAHIRRHDYLINVLQTTIETLCFYHPAVWWVSRIIRQERENCCDDVAVALCDDKAIYADALLAMDKLRPTKPSLALSAKGGSLLCRIRRLAGLTPSDRSTSNWWTTGLIVATAVMSMSLVLPMSTGANATMDEDASSTEVEWGEAVNGLRMRAVPVDVTMDEDNVDMDAVKRRFAAQKEVAFAIEMENVSDQTIQLLDAGYGNSFGDSSGKSNSNWYSQFLFTIDYYDADGKKLDYPLVEHVMPDMIVGSARIAEIAPGATHRFLIRPEKWRRVHYQQLPHRAYSAVVHYHGLSKHAEEGLQKRRPEGDALKTWSGDVTSAKTDFSFAPPKLPGTTLEWGEPDNGLRATMSIAQDLPWHGYGQKVDLLLHLQNASDEPITLSHQMWESELKLTMKDKSGNVVDQLGTISYSGITPICRTTLQPQQIIVIDAGNLAIAKTQEQADAFEHITNRKVVVPTGSYQLYLEYNSKLSPRMQDGEGNQLAPLEGDWVGKITSGRKYLNVKEEAFDMDAKDLDNASTPRQWVEIYVHHLRDRHNADGTYPSSVFDSLRKHVRAEDNRLTALGPSHNQPGAKSWDAAIAAKDTWTHDELVAHLHKLADWNFHVIGMARYEEIEASEYPRDRPMPGRMPVTSELDALKFGPAAENGLRVAWVPESDGAVHVGEAVDGRFVFHNSGDEAVTFSVEPWGWTKWTARDQQDNELQRRQIPIAYWIGTYEKFRLEPGFIAETIAEPLGFGALSVVDHSLATRWMPAVGGNVLTVSGTVLLGQSDLRGDAKDEFVEPLPIGEHTFTVTGGNVVDPPPKPRNSQGDSPAPAATLATEPEATDANPKPDPPDDDEAISTGLVVDTAGDPVAGVDILVFQGQQLLNERFVTDDAGRFQVPRAWRNSAPYSLIARDGDNHIGWFKFSTQKYSTGGQKPDVEPFRILLMPLTYEVSGQLVAANGSPIEGAEVLAMFLNSDTNLHEAHFEERRVDGIRIVPGGVSDSNGEFRIMLPAGSSGSLRVHHPDFATQYIHLGRDDVEDSAPTVLNPGAIITGEVTDTRTGKPLPGVRMVASANTDERISREHGGWTEAISDANGRYEIRGLMAGNWSVMMLESPDPKLTVPAIPVENLAAGQTKVVDVSLKPGLRVYGTLSDAKTGRLVPNWPMHCSPSSRYSGVISGTTNQNGEFEFYVPPGKVRIYVAGNRERADFSDMNIVVTEGEEPRPLAMTAGPARGDEGIRIFSGLPLERKVSLEAKRMPLHEALKTVCDQAGLISDLDGDGLKYEGYTRNMSVTLVLDDVELRDALDEIIKPFPAMAWTISQNLDAPPGSRIFISSKSEVEKRETDAAESLSERRLNEITLTGIVMKDGEVPEAWLRHHLDKHIIVRQGETIAIENRELTLKSFGTRSVDWEVDGDPKRLRLGASFDRLEDVKQNDENKQTENSRSGIRQIDARVHRSDGGLSGASVSVTLSRTDGEDPARVLVTEGERLHSETLTTDSAGRYAITIPEEFVGDPNLRVAAVVEKTGYITRQIGPTLVSDFDNRKIATDEGYWLKRQMDRNAFRDAQLREGIRINGRLLLPDGTPAGGAEVVTSTKYFPYSWKFHDPNHYSGSDTAITDAEGRFSVLADQRATMIASLDGHAPLVIDNLHEFKSPYDEDPALTYRLPPAIRPHGQALKQDGQPIAYAIVRVRRDAAWNEMDMPLSFGRASVADRNGMFELPPLPPGSYTVTCNAQAVSPNDAKELERLGQANDMILSAASGSDPLPYSSLTEIIPVQKVELSASNPKPVFDLRGVPSHTITVRIEVPEGADSTVGRAPLIPIEGMLNGDRWSGISIPAEANEAAVFTVPRGVQNVRIGTGIASFQRSPDAPVEIGETLYIGDVNEDLAGIVISLAQPAQLKVKLKLPEALASAGPIHISFETEYVRQGFSQQRPAEKGLLRLSGTSQNGNTEFRGWVIPNEDFQLRIKSDVSNELLFEDVLQLEPGEVRVLSLDLTK